MHHAVRLEQLPALRIDEAFELRGNALGRFSCSVLLLRRVVRVRHDRALLDV